MLFAFGLEKYGIQLITLCFLFQDGRICRISFAVQPDRLELGKPDGNEG